MIRMFILSILLILLMGQANAQSTLPVFRNLQSAYEEGTRAANGAPGPNYWQNSASYTIEVELDPNTRVLSGAASIKYFNNSPDSLRLLRLKLQANRYKKGEGRSGGVAVEDVHDGVDIQRVVLNGKEVEDFRINGTFMDIRMKDQLAPKSNCTLEVDWSYTLPANEGASREYVGDSTVFFVPYWYPQVAVYDDIRGWASFPYTGLQEFYHDFADYDVTIKMPEGFMVWATGVWQNPEDILQKEVLLRWKDAHSTRDVTGIWTEDDLKAGKVFKKNPGYTFHYKATDVPDFVITASSRYNWDATSVVVDGKTRRRTLVSAVYDTDSEDYYRVCRIAANGIDLMSNWLPGYPFPYPCLTVFNGNDGMEFPMFCNDASLGKRDPSGLTVHETAHTYFPFMMGINEQEYAWMDEGWASFFDYLLVDSLNNTNSGRIRGYSRVAGTDVDVPLMVRSSNLERSAYRISSYTRPQAAYLTLLDLLGYETFHKCMVGYMDRWKSKHPIPYDFFYTWNNLSGQNLDWFWKPWFFEWGFPDLGIESVKNQKNRSVVTIERIGNQPIPIELRVEYTDGTVQTIHETAAAWKTGATEKTIELEKGKSPKSITLGGRSIPDVNEENDVWVK